MQSDSVKIRFLYAIRLSRIRKFRFFNLCHLDESYASLMQRYQMLGFVQFLYSPNLFHCQAGQVAETPDKEP